MTQSGDTSPPPGPAFTETIDVAPAAKVFDEACPTDLEDQRTWFDRQGFLVLPGVLGTEELAKLDRELTRLVEQHESAPRIREGYDLEPTQDGSRPDPSFRKIGGITELSAAFERLLRHRRVLEVLRAILGPDISLYRDVVMMKPARVGREKPWHQDSVYWPWRPMKLVSAMTALDDATPENGCLQVIPGSHKQTLQHYGGELRLDLTPQQQAQTVYVPLRAGDTLLFHSLLLHASEPNPSDQDRRVCINAYKPAEARFIGEGSPPDLRPV